jgi:glycosyltransferase involved in cell wall biosynthesis
MQIKLVTEELRRRGHICEVLKINEGRTTQSTEYIDVQGGLDYLRKVWLHGRRGYQLLVQVNGMSKKGYLLALTAVLIGRVFRRPTLLTFQGGCSQDYFPRRDNSLASGAFYLLFQAAGRIACNSQPIKEAIERYGVATNKIEAIAAFSRQYVDFVSVPLPEPVEKFLDSYSRIVFCYASFRPEYQLEVLREGIRLYRQQHPEAGLILLGFPGRELVAAEEFVHGWQKEERSSLLLLGNLPHHEFLTLLSRSFICLRTPACDGVCASVLEALALGVPVVASENECRPAGVITYRDSDAADMNEKLNYVTEHYQDLKARLGLEVLDDNVSRLADWMVGDSPAERDIDAVAC